MWVFPPRTWQWPRVMLRFENRKRASMAISGRRARLGYLANRFAFKISGYCHLTSSREAAGRTAAGRPESLLQTAPFH